MLLLWIEEPNDNYINKVNAKLTKYEIIKKYKVLENDFSTESGELTVTLKLKRNIVRTKYSAIIDEMYAGDK